MKQRLPLILLVLSGLLFAVILLTEKEIPEGQGKLIFQGDGTDITEIRYQGPMQHQGKQVTARYTLRRKKAASIHDKAILQAEVLETKLAKGTEFTRTIQFALSAPANSYFEELQKLTAFYTLPDEEKLRNQLGFTTCEQRVTMVRRDNSETIFCLGPLTYNQARQYVLIPGKSIHITYRHVWQRYENSVYALAENRLVPETDLYNKLEIVLSRSFGEKKLPNIFKESGGRIVLQPRKQVVGLKRDQETIVWEFADNENWPAHLAPRLQATIEALRFRDNLREPEAALPPEPAFGIRLARRDKNNTEQTVNMIRFFPPEKKIPLVTLDGKPAVQGTDWLCDNQNGFGLLKKDEVDKFIRQLTDLEQVLAKNQSSTLKEP